MKRYVMGTVASLCGAIILSGILIAGAIYSSTLDSWSGSSKFWYAIKGSGFYQDRTPGMGLAFLFYLSILLLFGGLASILYEHFKGHKLFKLPEDSDE